MIYISEIILKPVSLSHTGEIAIKDKTNPIWHWPDIAKQITNCSHGIDVNTEKECAASTDEGQWGERNLEHQNANSEI